MYPTGDPSCAETYHTTLRSIRTRDSTLQGVGCTSRVAFRPYRYSPKRGGATRESLDANISTTPT